MAQDENDIYDDAGQMDQDNNADLEADEEGYDRFQQYAIYKNMPNAIYMDQKYEFLVAPYYAF
jgi:hypothetical protein